jgi:penicillin amidase
MAMDLRSVLRAGLTLVVGGLVGGCALLAPMSRKVSLQERLEAFPTTGMPLEQTVTIHWDSHQIPYIEANSDADAAFALGLVHAHLRLGQLAIYRRIAAGRIAEMGGPLATDIDHGLRILNFGRAAAEIEAALPATTRNWLQRFVDGINHYQRQARRLPAEYAILGLEREDWRIADILTFGRLAGTDVNWLVWFNLLRLRARPDWPQIWARLVRNGSDSVPSFAAADGIRRLSDLLAGISRSGSNSLAVAAQRSATGGAFLANDPHLGINLPNSWLLVGIRSPSVHAVGLMVPGLPIFAIGRNPWIAWGGTNMRAAASDLLDVAELPPDRIRERRETIRVRGWFDREIVIRESPVGPIVSDAPQFKDSAGTPLALRWTGHQVSDEIGAMLAVSRARDFTEFRDAFASFAVPGQNMVYADAEGNIGQVMAVRLPAREPTPPEDLVLTLSSSEAGWQGLVGTSDLPFSYRPERGFLASANNRPVAAPVPVGFFFSPDDRIVRLTEILGGNAAVAIDDVRALQQDVYMASSAALRDRFIEGIDELAIEPLVAAEQQELIRQMRSWDGRYDPGSRGAVAFECFRHAFTEAFYAFSYGSQDWAAFANIGRVKSLLLEDIERTDAATLDRLLRQSLATAARDAQAVTDWGDMHRLRLRHPLAFLPVVGWLFRFGEYPIGGSTDTLMKTAHAATGERHRVAYGSNARHISDLSDPDHNFFVLLGGQDGWMGSTTFVDQVPSWLAGEYIRLPLRPETVRTQFPHKSVLSPSG